MQKFSWRGMVISLFVSLSCISLANAGIENRPLNSDEATVLRMGQIVIATGGSFLKQLNKDKEYGWVTDLEYGILKSLELDLEVPHKSLIPEDSTQEKGSGLGDISTWLEWQTSKEEGYFPTSSFAFTWKSKSGNQNKNLGSGENSYTFTSLISKNLNELLSAHINFGYTYIDRLTGSTYRNSWNYNGVLEYQMTSKWMAVGEIYGQFVQIPIIDAQPLDGLVGVIATLSDSVAMDVGIGAGLTNASPDFRSTVGIAYSF